MAISVQYAKIPDANIRESIRNLDPDRRSPLTASAHADLSAGQKSALTRALNKLAPSVRSKVVSQAKTSAPRQQSTPKYQSSIAAIPYSQWQGQASGQTLDPKQWTVFVAQIGKYVQFATEQLADQDIQNHGAGEKWAPRGKAAGPAVKAPAQNSSKPWLQIQVPPSSSGWWKVDDGQGKSWKFTDKELAQKCAHHFGRTPYATAPSSWPSSANPTGPRYS